MEQDRNLLFGVLAVQLMRITPAQLMDAAGAWALDPSRPLSQRLVESNVLTPTDVDFIDDVVNRAMVDHGGNAAATLASFGGMQKVRQTFRGSVVVAVDGSVTLPAANTPEWGLAVGDAEQGVIEADGRYTFLAEHAQGGMGRVLLVHDDHLGREVALKELLPHVADSPAPSMHFISRFLQEAKITGQLEHPAIVPVHELGHRLDGALYYTMRFVRGRTLAKALRDSLSLGDRLVLLKHVGDLCQAMAYAHSRNVVHRDIKPDNVMIGEFGETVVLDWGLAKIKGKADSTGDALASTVHILRQAADDASKTADGAILGTPQYMSPEQAKGQLDLVDERSDVYALGAVLYELLTGRPLFTGRTTREVLARVVEDSPRPVLELEPAAPPELVAICERATARQREDRYPTARELARDIEHFMRGRFVEAYRYGAWEHARRFTRKNLPVMLTAILAIGIAFALFAAIDVFFQRQSLKLMAASIVRDLDTGLVAAAAVLDGDGITQTLAGLAKDPNVRGACVYTPDNQVLGTYVRKGSEAPKWPPTPPESGYHFSEGLLHVSSALKLQGNRYGTLYLAHDAAALAQRTNVLTSSFLVLCLVAVGLAVALFSIARGTRHTFADSTR